MQFRMTRHVHMKANLRYPNPPTGMASTASCHLMPQYRYFVSHDCASAASAFLLNQCLFLCMLNVIHSFLIAHFKQQRLVSNSGKWHWKCMKCSKQVSVTIALEEHRLLHAFLFSIKTWGNFGWRLLAFRSSPNRLCR